MLPLSRLKTVIWRLDRQSWRLTLQPVGLFCLGMSPWKECPVESPPWCCIFNSEGQEFDSPMDSSLHISLFKLSQNPRAPTLAFIGTDNLLILEKDKKARFLCPSQMKSLFVSSKTYRKSNTPQQVLIPIWDHVFVPTKSCCFPSFVWQSGLMRFLLLRFYSLTIKGLQQRPLQYISMTDAWFGKLHKLTS